MRIANRRLLGLVMLLALVAGVVVFRGAGRWLTREDPLSRADVILVLSGGMPYAAQEAGRVFKMGYSSEVWVSRPESPAGKLEKQGIHFVGEEEYNREILNHAGVPDASIHILPDTIVETEQEVAEAAREMRLTGKTKVIIVTSPQHTRRVKTLWKKLAGDNSNVIVHAAPTDPFDADHWWRNSRDAFSVVREALGLVNALTGLHVRPPHAD
jgi:uncharacterized SAM-binding protein YcdF (DUF218 family)